MTRSGRLCRAGLLSALAMTAFAGSAAAAPAPVDGGLAAARGLELARAKAARAGGLADPRLAEVAAAVTAGEAPGAADVNVVGRRVRVEVLPDGAEAAARAAVARAGGTVTGGVPGMLLEALVPAGRLAALEGDPAVAYVRLPLVASAPQDDGEPAVPSLLATQRFGPRGDEPVVKTNASAWHAAGWSGAGVRVGIVDYFDGTIWQRVAGEGDLPAQPAGVFCRRNGVACDVWAGGSAHGVAVGETILDMAPRATLYLATAQTTADLQAAVDWFHANGVRVISRSLTAEYDGPGDGTRSALDAVAANAVSRGIAWFNSAGNSAGGPTRDGSYWRGTFDSTLFDRDGDGWLEFTADGSEFMGMNCTFVNGLRWSDWGPNTTDYDVYVVDQASQVIAKSEVTQKPDGSVPPLEHFSWNCEANPFGYLMIYRFAPGSGTAGDVLETMVNGAGVQYWSNPYSATQPIADANLPGVVGVGAVDPIAGTTLAEYSSWGPANDGRIKPDLSAGANFSSGAYPQDGFNGTSAATPVVAGAAALVLESGARSPAQLTAFLTAAVDERGTAGPDNLYGTGELRLPSPPARAVAPRIVGVAARPQRETVIGVNARVAAGTAAATVWLELGGKRISPQRTVAAGADATVALDASGALPWRVYSVTVVARSTAGTVRSAATRVETTDVTRPRLTTRRASGRGGTTVKLRFTASDNSRLVLVRVTVFRNGRRFAQTREKRYDTAKVGTARVVGLALPRAASASTWRYCVRVRDLAGHSLQKCSGIAALPARR